MKKLYSMICICGLIIAMVGMISIRPAIGQDCQEVEVDVKPGRRNTIRLNSMSWVPIVISCDPNEALNTADIDTNSVTINGEYVQPLGAMLLRGDLILFYLANNLNLVEADIVDGEIDITVMGDFVIDDEVVDCFVGTDTVGCMTSRFNFGSNFGSFRDPDFGSFRDRWNSRRGK